MARRISTARGRPSPPSEAGVDQHLHPDERELHGVRWWSPSELQGADASRFEPHLARALEALEITT